MKFIAWTTVDMQINDEKKEAFHSNIRVQFYKYRSYLKFPNLKGLAPRTLPFSEATTYPNILKNLICQIRISFTYVIITVIPVHALYSVLTCFSSSLHFHSVVTFSLALFIRT